MKIWLLSHTFYPAQGGIENYFYEVGKVLRRMGHQPFILCRRHLPSLPEREEWEGITVIRHPDFAVPRSRLFRKPSYLTEKLSEWLLSTGWARGDMVISRYPYYQVAFSLLRGSTPDIYIPASVLPNLISLMIRSGSWKEKIFFHLWKGQIYRLEKKALLSAARVVVFSQNMREQLEKYYGFPSSQVKINPPGVDSERFAPGKKDPELLRRFDIQPGTIVLLSLGRLSPEKNLIFFIQAAAPLLKEGGIKLLIVGEGPDRVRLERTVKKMGLRKEVILTGNTKNPEKYYRLGDIFISPSRYESFGQAILEAMASGLPVLALKRKPPGILNAAEEIIREGRNGFCIPPKKQALQNKLKQLLDNPDLRREMGKKGREICLAGFTWERHVRELINPDYS